MSLIWELNHLALDNMAASTPINIPPPKLASLADNK
jgi:hypothetical protein